MQRLQEEVKDKWINIYWEAKLNLWNKGGRAIKSQNIADVVDSQGNRSAFSGIRGVLETSMFNYPC